MHILGTAGIDLWYPTYRNGQPVPVGQVGIGMACEITRLCVPVTGAAGFVVNALARAPANTTERIDV